MASGIDGLGNGDPTAVSNEGKATKKPLTPDEQARMEDLFEELFMQGIIESVKKNRYWKDEEEGGAF